MAAPQIVFFTLLAGCATGGAPGAPAQPQAQRPREFVRVVAAVNSTPVALNQMIGAATGSQPGMEAISAMVSSGLTIVDHAGVIQPLLAESVPTVENGGWKVSPDGQMEITWKIRPGAQWHDGTAFTAADIVFTQQVQLDRDIALFGHSSYRQLDTVEAPDPRTVTTRWKGAFIYANLTFGYDGDRSLMPLPKHLLERSFQEDKAGFASLPYWTSQFVGTGAYRLKEWVEGSHVVVQANDQYVLGRPKIDEIEVKFIPDRNTLLSNMLAGTVEVNLGRGLEPAEARQVLERMEGWKTDNAVIGAFAAYPQFINPDPPLLANVQLRRALHHAIDRQEMLDTLYFGQSTIAHSFLHDGEPDFKDGDSVTVKYPYDPGRATQLIEQLGYRKGADGGFRDPAGQRLSVEARTGRGSENIMLSVASYWNKIGLNAEEVVIPPQLDRDVQYRSEFPAFEIVRRGNYRWDLYRVLGSTESPMADNRFQGGNRGRYQNAELDAVIQRYMVTIPFGERTDLLKQIVRHISDQAVILWLYHGIDATVSSKRLQNVHGKYERTTQAWNVHLWEVQ